MDYEKKYKEAQGWIEKIYPTLQHEQQMEAEAFFPELAESEDERIRKAIHIYLDWLDGRKDCQPKGDYTIKDMIAWLEKQGENEANKMPIWKHWKDGICGNGEGKPIYLIKDGDAYSISSVLGYECDYIELSELDKSISVKDIEKIVGKVEPKFHEGEWITNGDYTWKIIDVKPLDYILQSQDGNIVDDTIFHVDEQFNLWTIQDAKPGDVLAYGDNPNDCHVEVTMIFKSVRNEKSAFTHFHFFDDKFRVNDWCDCGKNAHPATKEQCDSLMKAMTDAGYEWNEEKKELKLLITNGGDFESENCEQKPAWSEEDERLCSCLIEEQEESLNNLKNDKYGHSEIISDLKEMYRERIDWLKALKQRIGG